MEKIQITVEQGYENKRLDMFLASMLEDMSRNYIQRLIEKGMVSIQGNLCTVKKRKIISGEVIEITVPTPEHLNIQAQDIPIEIVYEDEHLAVVNKPKGMVVHPAGGNETGTLVNAMMFHCKNLSSINGIIRPGIVHRIDKDTSGLLMIAKDDKTHVSLAKQLKEHTITRRYWAIVYDNIKEEEGTVDAPIGRHKTNRLKMAVTNQNARNAITHYRVLERFGKFTLIEARLETGRTHQIRVHMAYIKHPLLGDSVYGPQKDVLGAQGQMLQAKVLGFVHPIGGEYLEFESPLTEEFTQVLTKLRQGALK